MHSIGIDFGTTKTLVARWDKKVGMAVTARLGNGRDAVPTTVYVDGNGHMCYSDAAEDRLEQDILLAPEKRTGRHIRGFKMRMGSGIPVHIVMADDDIRNIFAEDLVCDYLKNVRETTERMVFMGEPVTKAVITRPVKFSPVQCENLKKCAIEAGFTEVEFTTEPEAAGMAFCARNAAEAFRRSALIIDWGGGTLDLAWVTRENTPAGERICTNPRYTDGVMNMAGELFDELLLNDVKQELARRFITDVEDLRLLPRVRRAKEALSSAPETMLYVATSSGATEPICITREHFNSLIAESVDKAVNLVKNLLARIPEKDKPELLLLVGGSSRIPFIRERLEQACDLPAKAWQFSQEAVALGAAQCLVGLSKVPDAEESAPKPKKKLLWVALFLLLLIGLGLLPLVYPLQAAIRNGHAAYARCLIMLGADVNRLDEHGDSLLHLAVRNDHAQCVRLLVDNAEVDLIKKNDAGETPLALAIDGGYTESQQTISDAITGRGLKLEPPKVVVVPSEREQPELKESLHTEPSSDEVADTKGAIEEEAQRKLEEAAQRLREEEARLKREAEEAKRKREAAEAQRKLEEEEAQRQLEEEARRKFEEEEAQRQLEEEARRKLEEEEAQRKLEEEARRKLEEEAQRKLEEEARRKRAQRKQKQDLIASYYTAAQTGDVTKLKECLDKGVVTLSSTNAAGHNALYLAVMHGQDTIVQELLKRGAGVLTSVNGKTYRTLAREQGQTACLRLLAQEECKTLGITESTCDAPVLTALNTADAERLLLLVEAYASRLKAMRLGKNNKTVLYMAIKGSTTGTPNAAEDAPRAELLQILIEAGIDLVSCADKEWNPLHLASSYGYAECLDVLLQSRGASGMLERDSSQANTTALWLAAERGNAECVEMLLNYGAVNGKKANGKTPLEIARDRASIHKAKNAASGKRYQRCVELLR